VRRLNISWILKQRRKHNPAPEPSSCLLKAFTRICSKQVTKPEHQAVQKQLQLVHFFPTTAQKA